MRVLNGLFDIYPGILADRQLLAQESAAAWERRKQAFPQEVAADRMTPEQAQAELRAWAAIAKDWRWIHSGEGQPASAISLNARLEVLEAATLLIRQQMDSRTIDADTEEQYAAIIALRYWAEEEEKDVRLWGRPSLIHPRGASPARHAHFGLPHSKSSPSTCDGEGDRRAAGVVGPSIERQAA